MVAQTCEQRLKTAADGERATDQPIEQIRSATGYLDPASFRRAFRQAAGISPRQYRATYTTVG